MSNNDHYFETLKTIQGEMTDEVLIQRIDECTSILNELVNSRCWDVLLRDNKRMCSQLDDSWQDIPLASPKLPEARILKMATKHIIELPMKYAQELDMLTEELKKRQSPDEEISKDSDNE